MKRSLRIVLLVALVLGFIPFGVRQAYAAAGGPIVLMGIDAEDGGPGGHGPLSTYVNVVNNILGQATNGGSGILVIGANGGSATSFWVAMDAAITTQSVTYVNAVSGPNSIATIPFTGFRMIAVVSDEFNTSGGLTAAQNTALGGRQADVAAFVNAGGGLLGFASAFSNSYPYLAGLGAFTIGHPAQYQNINPTAAGLAVGIDNALDVCCWHDEYLTYPPFLQVLATNANTGRAAALGGANVFISDIQLSPATATNNVGVSHTLTANVVEQNAPAVGKTVTFSVTSGPHAGTTGTGVTDSLGNATFSYIGTAAGTDTIVATFVNSQNETKTSNPVEAIWLQTNQPPTANAGGPYSVNEGSSIQLNGTGTDPDIGDTLTYSWSPATNLNDASLEDPTFTGVDDAVQTLTLTVSDGTASATATAQVTVLNVAPTVGPITAPTDPVNIANAVNVSSPFSDPGTLDTHTAVWDWGDGTTSAGSISSGTASGTHIYALPGVYTIQVTVTDDDGGVGTALYQYVVVYDPNGGFVTGGGWINSPEGAYIPDPTLTGRASFGFVSKYLPGRQEPDGRTEFQFQAGDLNFRSTSYDWLVISGARAQYRGTGTINGQGSYTFMLTAIDGQASGGGGIDKFRMKIWGSTGVVYDNGLGAPDPSDPPTALQGGSIVIHSR